MGKVTTKDLARTLALVVEIVDRLEVVEADIVDIEDLFAKLIEAQPQHPIADAYLQFFNTKRN